MGSRYPSNHSSYKILREIGRGAFATVYLATVVSPSLPSTQQQQDSKNVKNNKNKFVYPHCALKVIDLERVHSSLQEMRTEVSIMRSVSHSNVLDAHACFSGGADGSEIWMVTDVMGKGSCLSAIKSLNDVGIRGMDEVSVKYVIGETVKGLVYLHGNRHIHRDVKAGNILLGTMGGVKLADFGVSRWMQSSTGSGRVNTKTFVGTPCWMAPEVMEQVDGYDYKADVWSLGITCLELCMGSAPYAHFPPMKVLLLTIQDEPPGFDSYASNGDAARYGKDLKDFVQGCLKKDVQKRMGSEELERHKFLKFANAEGPEAGREEIKRHFVKNILDHCSDIYEFESAKTSKKMEQSEAATGGGGGGGEGVGAGVGGAKSAALRSSDDVGSTANSDAKVDAGNGSVDDDGLNGSSIVNQRLSESAGLSRPQGTTWVFDERDETPSGAAVAHASSSNDPARSGVKSSTPATAAADETIMTTVGASRPPSGTAQTDDQFFDQFEKSTGGENFDRNKRDREENDRFMDEFAQIAKE